MSDVRLSIIIPHYNSADLLDVLLDSIPNIQQIQAIVVDDHSTEKLDALEACKEKYKNTNVEFYINECNKSAGGARNTGLKYAKGKWLLFADADDYFLTDFYKNVEPYFEKEYDLVYFRSTSIDLATGQMAGRHWQVEQLIKDYFNKPDYKWLLRLKYNYFSPCAKLVRRELFDKYDIRFDEVMVANDVMCSIKLAFYSEEVHVSDKIIYCITKQPGTLTTFVTEDRFDARMNVYYARHKFLRENLSKKDYDMLRFNAKVRLKQVRENHLGWKKYFSVLQEMIRQGIPVWREFTFSYYYERYWRIWMDVKARYFVKK